MATNVGTRELDSWRGSTAGGARDADLDTSHVELSAWVGASRVEGNNLTTEEVVSVGSVGGELDVPLTSALVETVNSPDTAAQPLLLDLEPVKRSRVGGSGSIVNLRKVNDDWALVGRGNWVITVGWALHTVWKWIMLV